MTDAARIVIDSVRSGDRWIRWTTTASVMLLAGIAAVVSYGHMHTLTLAHGESAWTATLVPLSVDGMIVASSMTLLLDSRSGQRGSLLPWMLLAAGSAASLAANVAVAEPTTVGRVIAAWPSFALIGSYELLMCQIRNLAAGGADGAAHVAPARADVAGATGDEVQSGRAILASGDSFALRPGARAQGRVEGGRSRGRHGREADLLSGARRIDAEHRALKGRPASAETLRVRLRVGAASARALKDRLRSESAESVGAPAARLAG